MPLIAIQIERDFDEEAKWANWDIDHGYKTSIDATNNDIDDPDHDMPIRALAPGLHMGLSVLLDVKEDEYFCSGTESVGFKGIDVH